MNSSFINPPQTTFEWIMVACGFAICLPQGILLFRDAQKRGRFPWLWGLWGILSFPLPAVFYYFLIVRPDKKKQNTR
jgi:hypothetical protein